jgi:hypothetical protein
MSGQILSAVVAALLLSGVVVGMPNAARADDCLTGPNSGAPQGSHWYYRLDRTNQHKCWYLRAPGRAAQQPTVQAASKATPAAQSYAIPAPSGSRPANPSAGAPASISPNDSAPPLPHAKMLAVKPKPAPPLPKPRPARVVPGSAQEGSTQAIPEAPAPQASTSAQIGGQTDGMAPAAAAAWPDAQADGSVPVAAVAWPDAPAWIVTSKAQEPITVPSDARVASVDREAEARASDDAESAARGGEPMPSDARVASVDKDISYSRSRAGAGGGLHLVSHRSIAASRRGSVNPARSQAATGKTLTNDIFLDRE